MSALTTVQRKMQSMDSLAPMNASETSSVSSDLMGSSSVDISDHTTQLYKAALGSFINKQFAESVEIIEPILRSTSRQSGAISLNDWVRLWNLYLAILNTAAEQISLSVLSVTDSGQNKVSKLNGARSSVPLSSSAIIQVWSDAERQKLASRLWDNSIWQDIIDSFDGLQSVPPQLVVSLMSLSLKHSKDISFVARTAESYLVSIGYDLDPENLSYLKAYLRVIEVYASEILTHEGEFELASEFVSMNVIYPEARKPILLEKILEAKKLSAERAQIEEKQIKLQQAKKDQEIRDQEKRDQEKREQEVKENALSRIAEKNTVSLQKSYSRINPETTEEQYSTGSETPQALPIRDTREDNLKSHSSIWNSLQLHWRTTIRNAVNYSTLTNYLFPFFCFLLIASRPMVRQKIRAILAQLWVKLVQTFSMGMKVSYV